MKDELNENEKTLLNELNIMNIFTIDIGGGEPLLNPRLAKFVNSANNLGIRCNIATNLSFSSKFIKTLYQKD